MRLVKHLNEIFREYKDKKPRSQELEYLLSKTMIEENCSEILNTYRNVSSRIYRGAAKSSGYYFTNPNLSKRMSRNTLNFYTTLFDNLPSWENYPKRSNGIICSSEYTFAAGYGAVYVAFPYNGAKIGVCPRGDIWESFKTIESDLSGFNSELQACFYKMKLDLTGKTDLNKAFKEMKSSLVASKEILDEFNRLFVKMKYDNKDSLLKFFDKVFDPEKAGFSLYTTKNYNPPPKKEVWFDKSAVMVKDETLLRELDVYI